MLDKLNEQKQLGNSEISSFIEENGNCNTTRKIKTDLNVEEEELEWLANIHPSLLDKLNEQKQLGDSEISSFIEENRNSKTTKKTKTDLTVWIRWCSFKII